MKVKNTFIIFIVSGFWHGANWTFIVWGALNAFYFLPLLLTNNNRKNLDTVALGKWLPSLKELLSITTTFILTVIAWIFFRAENLNHAFEYIYNLFSDPSSYFSIISYSIYKTEILLIIIFIFLEWIGRNNQHALEKFGLEWKKKYRYAFYQILILVIIWFSGKDQEFIYFQF